MTTNLPLAADEGSPWDRALEAFLAEKHRRPGSARTPEAYRRLLKDLFGRTGKTPDQLISQDVFTWAYGVGISLQTPSANTVGSRIACVSSFYRFLIRMGVLRANPCDALERPKATPSTPRGLSAEEVQRLLAIIPTTPVGLRDRAIVLTLILTGRRRAEVMALTAGDLSRQGGAVFYRYRGKGGKRGTRELPLPAFQAIERALAAWGKRLEAMGADESLWPGNGRSGITSSTFYGHLQRYLASAGLPPTGVHVFRHTAAKLRRDAGASVEEVSQFLDHSNLAVTSVYLQRLEGQVDARWAAVAATLGLS
ncbi:MAG: tyrosine-type recombinase/integrase [Chloroflexota bacterium]